MQPLHKRFTEPNLFKRYQQSRIRWLDIPSTFWRFYRIYKRNHYGDEIFGFIVDKYDFFPYSKYSDYDHVYTMRLALNPNGCKSNKKINKPFIKEKKMNKKLITAIILRAILLVSVVVLVVQLVGCATPYTHKNVEDQDRKLATIERKVEENSKLTPLDKLKEKTYLCLMGLVDREIDVTAAEAACSKIYRKQNGGQRH